MALINKQPKKEIRFFPSPHSFTQQPFVSCGALGFLGTRMIVSTLLKIGLSHMYFNVVQNCSLLTSSLQECFYQCSPKVYKWKHPTFEGALKGILIFSFVDLIASAIIETFRF